MQNHTEPLLVELGNKKYILIINDFDGEPIDIAEHVKPDYSNIIGDLITFPVLLNQVANLKSEVETVVSRLKLEIEIHRAFLEKSLKLSKTSGAKTTVAEVENHVISDITFQEMSHELINRQYQQKILENFYWQGQTKMEVILKISDKIQPNEFNQDILEKSVNRVLIKKANIKL